MKKTVILCLFALLAMCSLTTKADVVETSDNKLSIKVLPTKNIAKIPVEISLTNPVEMTCVQCYIATPTGKNTFVTSVKDSTKVLWEKTERWDDNHITMFAWNESKHPNLLMAMVVNTSSLNFEGNAGPVLRLFINGSDLEDGDYCVKLQDGNMVWTDRKKVTTYLCPDVQANFKIKKHKLVLK